MTREDLTQEHQAAYDRIANTRGVVGPNFQGLFNSPVATERFASFVRSRMVANAAILLGFPHLAKTPNDSIPDGDVAAAYSRADRGVISDRGDITI